MNKIQKFDFLSHSVKEKKNETQYVQRKISNKAIAKKTPPLKKWIEEIKENFWIFFFQQFIPLDVNFIAANFPVLKYTFWSGNASDFRINYKWESMIKIKQNKSAQQKNELKLINEYAIYSLKNIRLIYSQGEFKLIQNWCIHDGPSTWARTLDHLVATVHFTHLFDHRLRISQRSITRSANVLKTTWPSGRDSSATMLSSSDQRQVLRPTNKWFFVTMCCYNTFLCSPSCAAWLDGDNSRVIFDLWYKQIRQASIKKNSTKTLTWGWHQLNC